MSKEFKSMVFWFHLCALLEAKVISFNMYEYICWNRWIFNLIYVYLCVSIEETFYNSNVGQKSVCPVVCDTGILSWCNPIPIKSISSFLVFLYPYRWIIEEPFYNLNVSQVRIRCVSCCLWRWDAKLVKHYFNSIHFQFSGLLMPVPLNAVFV